MLVESIHIHYILSWLNLGTIALLPILATLLQLRAAIDTHSFEPNCPAFIAAAQQFPSILHAYALQEIQVSADNLHRGLLVGISALEEVLVWFIGIYKSTYRCLLGLAVNGAISVVSAIAAPVQTTAEHILQGIGLVDSEAVGTSAGAGPIPWMNGLSAVQDKVQEWANGTSDPLDKLVRAPFEEVKAQLDRDLGSYKAGQLEPSTITTEGFSQLNACDYPPALTGALDSARSKLLFLVNMLLAVVVLLLLVIIFIQIFSIWHRHQVTQRWTRQTARDIEALKATESVVLTHKLAHLGLAHQRPWLAWLIQRWSLPANSWLDSSWILAFTHPIVLYCLVIGATGLFFIWLMGLIATEAQGQLQDTIQAAMQQQLSGNNTDSMAIMDTQLATLNTWLTEAETDLNKHAFGAIQSIALTANTTLGVVSDHISEFLTATLAGTLFESPLRDVLDCLVMNKIGKIQQGLIWISEQSHVNLTRLDPNQAHSILLGNTLLQGFDQPIRDIHASFGQTIKDTLQGHRTLYTILIFLWIASMVIVIFVHLGMYLKRKIIK